MSPDLIRLIPRATLYMVAISGVIDATVGLPLGASCRA